MQKNKKMICSLICSLMLATSNIPIGFAGSLQDSSTKTDAVTNISPNTATLNGTFITTAAPLSNDQMCFFIGTQNGSAGTALKPSQTKGYTTLSTISNGAGTWNYSFNVTDLIPGTTYYVQYAAQFNAANQAEWAEPVSFTTPNTTPNFILPEENITVSAGQTVDLKQFLHISDIDKLQTLVWSQSVAPNNGGTLTLSGTNMPSGGNDITPGGTLTYKPLDTYSGEEKFTIQISDGKITSTKTITATVKPKPYVSTFNSNGGSLVAESMINNENKITKPADPIKDGYTFAGWYKESEFTTKFDFANEIIANNITLYGKWTRNTYNVAFNSNGGSAVTESTVGTGDKIIKPTNPTKNGYTFDDWYKEAELTTKFDFANEIIPGNTTLYAKWIKNNSSSSSSSNRNSTKKEEPNQNVKVLVNKEEFNIGKETILSNQPGTTEAKITVEKDAILKQVEAKFNQGGGNTVEIPTSKSNLNSLKVGLTGDIVKAMEAKNFNVLIKKDFIRYTIPAKEIEISKIAEKIGVKTENLQKIEVEVMIKEPTETTKKTIDEAIKYLDKTSLIVKPVDFEVIATTTDLNGTKQQTSVDKFSQYVERIIEIPQGIDPSKITTGIVFNQDGTFQHVPTKVYQENNKWYAKINSLTNSTYSVAYNPVKIKSVENHWSQSAVNDMASRMVILDVNGFKPDEAITREEFADYISRALGIANKDKAGNISFTDVSTNSNFKNSIFAANQYGIINGYEDNSFKPNEKITREEAMSMFVRAMKVTKFNVKTSEILGKYLDEKNISTWAKSNVETAISSKIFNGRSQNTIEPKSTFTKAEAATAIRNLLIESNLINK